VDDARIYRWSGAAGLVSIGLFLIEFPIYFLRGPMPSLTAPNRSAYSARNAENMLTVVFLDMVIYCLFLIFLSGVQHFIQRTRPGGEFLGRAGFGAGLVYTALTLLADSFEGAIALDARTGSPDASVIRALMESQYLLLGSIGLILMALLLAAFGWACAGQGGFPRWTAGLGIAGAILCLAFVPSMFVGAPDLTAFYNPAGWGTTGVIAGFPLAAWTIAASILLMRRGRETSPPFRLRDWPGHLGPDEDHNRKS